METRKTVKFTPELTQAIIRGEKVTTFRLFDDKNLSTGDKIILATRDGEKVTEFAEGEITNVKLKTIGTLEEQDYVGHEPVDDPVKQYRLYYGDKVTLETEVKIINFEVTRFY